MLNRSTCALAFVLLIFCSSAVHSEDNFAYSKQMIEEDLSAFRALQRKWPKIEEKHKVAVSAYSRTQAAVKKCKAGAWRALFSKSFEELDSARKNLEASRTQLESARKAALSVLRAQNTQIAILEADYVSKKRGAEYYAKLATFVSTIRSGYYDITENTVYVGYESYGDGIRELSAAYQAAAKDCNSVIPLQLFRSVMGIITDKIDLVNLIADRILDLVPDELKKKS